MTYQRLPDTNYLLTWGYCPECKQVWIGDEPRPRKHQHVRVPDRDPTRLIDPECPPPRFETSVAEVVELYAMVPIGWVNQDLETVRGMCRELTKPRYRQ